MSLLLYLIIGGIVGALASAVAGRDEGIIASIVIGIVGSMLGGIVSSFLTGTDQAFLGLSLSGLFWSFLGALILVVILNAIQHRPTSHRV